MNLIANTFDKNIIIVLSCYLQAQAGQFMKLKQMMFIFRNLYDLEKIFYENKNLFNFSEDFSDFK